MENIAVFVNDAAHARHLLQPLLGRQGATHWVLVACPPVLTRHVGRWLSHAAREKWRERWSAELFAALEPELRAHGAAAIEKMIAQRPLVELSQRLSARLPQLRVLDARRVHLGRSEEPLTPDQPPSEGRGERAAGTIAAASSLGALLILAD